MKFWIVKNIRRGLQVSFYISVLCVLDKKSFDFHMIVLTWLEEGKCTVCAGDKGDSEDSMLIAFWSQAVSLSKVLMKILLSVKLNKIAQDWKRVNDVKSNHKVAEREKYFKFHHFTWL